MVATFDGAATHITRLWLDGELVSMFLNTAEIPRIVEGWTIGKQNCPCSSSTAYVGGIDELAINAGVLPQPRIQAHFAAARP